MGAPIHSETLKIPAKSHRYGRWRSSEIAKTTDFPGRNALSKKGGLAAVVEKCEFPRENATRYGFDPRKRPGILLKRSETMPKHSETMRV
jgi:hypothetical protein